MVVQGRFRSTLRVSRNDVAAPRWYRGKRRAAGEGVPLPETFSPPPFFFPFCSFGGPSFRRRRQAAAEPPSRKRTLSGGGGTSISQENAVRRRRNPHLARERCQEAAEPPSRKRTLSGGGGTPNEKGRPFRISLDNIDIRVDTCDTRRLLLHERLGHRTRLRRHAHEIHAAGETTDIDRGGFRSDRYNLQQFAVHIKQVQFPV